MKKKYRKKSPFVHNEQYEVRYDILKSDGFWAISQTELIEVPLKENQIGKDKHDEAARIFKKKFPKARVTGVTYL